MERLLFMISILILPTGLIALPEEISAGDVLINEIMANPVGLTAFPETEYVEIYNASGDTVSLDGWSFIYDGKPAALPDSLLLPGSYAVLFRNGSEVHVESGGIAIPVAKFPSALSNDGKTVKLINAAGLTIDFTSYAKAKAAQSWERDSAGDWYLSSDPRGGTPGAVNSPKDPPPVIPVPEPDLSQPGDVLISEIMANPAGLTAFPETEYVEIYNASGDTVSLNGWYFVYDGKPTALPDSLLLPGSYAVLFRGGREIHVESGGIAIPVATFPSALSNDGKTVKLVNAAGLTMDSANYAKAPEACAWERNREGDWYLSNDLRGGTPGTVNSPEHIPSRPDENGELPAADWIVYEKDLVFNEILPEPFPGGSEYIELYNRSGRTLRMIGLSIAVRRADGEWHTRHTLASVTEPLPPGVYVVLTGQREGVLRFYATSRPEAVCEVKLPELNNTGADLVLFRTKDGVVIDEVSYSSKWHNGAVKNPAGVSLERIQPEADTQHASNWTSATAAAGYGTPAGQNSQYCVPDNNKSISLLSPEYLPETGEYVIVCRTDRTGYRLKMEVFSLEGRKVAEISNNQLSGQDSEIRWDGCGLDGNRLRADVYIFYAECYHPDGQRQVLRKAFLIKPR
ncbi:MAG: lamin tail domain-containing protein [Tannerella sp.]|jgi:hypothetical protein|nr:lamin tail domain-containing protein [Tannerella sp.]